MRRETLRTLAVGVVSALALVFGVAGAGRAFDDRVTHPQLTDAAARTSTLGAHLKGELDVADGIDALLTSGGLTQPILEWLSRGSRLEDDPACRASNHFHNSLKPFPSAGVTDQPAAVQFACRDFRPVQSSATWGTAFVAPTERGPATGNPSDWDAARAAFLDALVLEAPAEREAALARTLETLGHVVHLVQDLAVPAHVRNDFQSHLSFFPKLASFTRWFENEFERFVRLRPGLIDAGPPPAVELAGRPVTRFWDIDQYTGANPSADLVQGLAEYANANFLSRNTVLTETLPPTDPHAFPYPRASSTNLADLFPEAIVEEHLRAEDGLIDAGLYLRKLADGETIDHFLRVGYLGLDAIVSAPPGVRRLALQIDDVVHADYAAKLLPRAVGYSAGLLDYFFRGRLDVDVVEDPIDPSVVRVQGTNGSPDALEGGVLQLYADDARGTRSALIPLDEDLTVSAAPGGPVESARFQAPPGAERYVAVYRGRLGGEISVAREDPQP